jgi:predicted nucleotidyltransferase
MTVVDERSRVPPLDKLALGRLAGALDRDGLVAAMVIGSQARGHAGPLSDVDVAYWHEPSLDAAERLRLRLDLAHDAARALATDEIDVIPLNQASPLLRQRAIRDGKRLLDRDPRSRIRLETRAIIEYLDTIPLRAELARGQLNRIREGRFGRR